MGGCASSSLSHDSSSTTTAIILISLHGELREYSAPITVSQVLQIESESESQSQSESSSLFVCNSDSLYYDDYIPAMNLKDELQPAQIYFLLSTSKLQHRLTASDMAALAVKASIALSKKPGHGRARNNSKCRISPVLDVNDRREYSKVEVGGAKKSASVEKPIRGRAVPSSSRSRLSQRYSSRRPRMAVRSFKIRLTTIYEEAAGSSVLY